MAPATILLDFMLGRFTGMIDRLVSTRTHA